MHTCSIILTDEDAEKIKQNTVLTAKQVGLLDGSFTHCIMPDLYALQVIHDIMKRIQFLQ